jgi:DNA-binding LacI/PurR family transcriptional regulator
MMTATIERPSQRSDAERVLQILRDYCRKELQPGSVVPNHRELMQRFEASERSVRWALNELRRQGIIIRRQGARTYVADPQSVVVTSANGSSPVIAARPAVVMESRTIVAIAVPDHAIFDQAMNLLVEKARVEDLSVVCHLFPGTNDVAMQSLPPVAHEPLGYIVFRRELLGLAEALQAEGHRVVYMGTPYVNSIPQVPSVYGDQEQGGYLAARHLIDLGHRRIAFCAFGDIQQSLRWQGHQRALREARKGGLRIDDSVLDLDDMRAWKENPALGRAIFGGPYAPTGLVVWNDHEAVMVMGQLTRLGLRVPQDVSIVGYDNLPEGEMQHPALTTVYSPMDQQLKTAINLLTRPEALLAPYQFLMQPILIPRESTVAPPSKG